jgi:2-oxoglutarate dehydrogenase E1 component
LDDPQRPKKGSVKKLIFCSGRIYFDLLAARKKTKAEDMAFIRIQQLYPLHKKKIKEIIDSYSGFSQCFWVQEEPSNMGAWDYMRPHLREMLPSGKEPIYIGRPRSATPAVGSHAMHKWEHAAIMNAVFKDYEFRIPEKDINIKS